MSSQSHRHEHKLKQHAQPATNKDQHSIRICRGPKPLEKSSFYLDLNSRTLTAKIENKIRELGGKIEVFLVNTVTVVVSDKTDKAGEKNCERLKWDYISGGSGGPPSLKSIEVPTPILTPPTPCLGNDGPLSNATNIRGQTTQRHKSRVDAMLERALTQPQQCSVDPLSNARNWGIPIWSTNKLLVWLDKIFASLKNYKQLKCDNSTKPAKSPKVTHLKEPFIKFAPYTRDKRPVFLELSSWPKLNLDGEPGSCPFIKQNPTKEIKKENRENAHFVNSEKEKEMTRRPRATATRTRRTELVSGYCEICRIDYKDLSKHLQSDQHLKFVQNNDNFLSLDKLIHTGASVEAFLKLNQSKNVNKNCKLFSNGERNDLIGDKIKKSNKSDLDFNVDDIEMVQCNGTRRELNLSSLTSAHNLRTRAKHESGHLLRSKGRSWGHEDSTNDKFFDKFEGFIIKKRAKGTIWLEEEEPENEIETLENNKSCDASNKQDDCSPLLLNDLKTSQELNDENEPKENAINSCNNQIELKNNSDSTNKRLVASEAPLSNKMKINGFSGTTSKENLKEDCNNADNQQFNENDDNDSVICNGVGSKHCNKPKRPSSSERGRIRGRRGGRSIRGRQRLSVEERLIEDNRAYYKVEVLGNKLRSSTIPSAVTVETVMPKEVPEKPKKEEEAPSSEKPVVVRFKRVRKSELSLLSDEAESFMFREPKREDSSECSEEENSSVLPKDTESETDENKDSIPLSSTSEVESSDKIETAEDDSQDSLSLSRAKKKRRTHAEALIKDNTDYYKFETPGSRLRYQAPLTGVKDEGGDPISTVNKEDNETEDKNVQSEKRLSSNPSARIEKMHFSFETVPKSEPWYQTYQRQDEGIEYWHYFSETDAKPFLLPYEIENFRENLLKSLPRMDSCLASNRGRRGRGRGGSSISAVTSRSPRKSPRCHASTLAIMSTIIRKREQQQQQQQPPPTLPAIEEESMLEENQLKHEAEVEQFKNVDEILMIPNEDENLDLDLLDEVEDLIEEPPTLPKGPPMNLLELLDKCHAQVPILDYVQSTASSECGELLHWPESPLRKRKKKRKNKTGWPGNRMRRKYGAKQIEDKVEHKMETENINENARLKTEFDDSRIQDKSERNENDNENREKEPSSLKIEETIETSQDSGKMLTVKNEELNKNEPNEISSVSSNECTNNERTKTVSDVEVEKASQMECESREDENAPTQRLLTKFVDEAREDSPVNDENHHENVVDNNRQPNVERSTKRKRPRTSTSCEDVPNSYHETEKEFSSNYEDAKRQNTSKNSETSSPRKRNFSRKRSRQRSRKRQRKRVRTSEIDLEVENDCKKEAFCVNSISINNSPRKNMRKSKDHDSEDLKERVTSTVLTPTELVQKRSSMEFQPVVRVMKIDDHVDMEHGIRSVTVASNRRLRSSDTSKTNSQSNRKRYKGGRSQLQPRRWMKSS